MRNLSKKWRVLAWALVSLTGGLLITWWALTYEPSFSHRPLEQSAQQRAVRSNHLEAEALRLRNDIVNEPRWEAVFWDADINSWLSEHFSSFQPPGTSLRASEPCVVFEPGRVLAACHLERGPARVVVWLAARMEAHAPDEVIVTIEKARIGIMPIPTESLLTYVDIFTTSNRKDLWWEKQGGACVIHVRVGKWLNHDVTQLDRLEVLEGHIRLLGRSLEAPSTGHESRSIRSARAVFP